MSFDVGLVELGIQILSFETFLTNIQYLCGFYNCDLILLKICGKQTSQLSMTFDFFQLAHKTQDTLHAENITWTVVRTSTLVY